MVTAAKESYQFGRTFAVPAAGTLQLAGPGTTLVGFRVLRPGYFVSASISVEAADGVRSYDLDIRRNGVSIGTVPLASGSTSNQANFVPVPLAVGDIITTFMVRTAGAGASTFGEEHAAVEISYAFN